MVLWMMNVAVQDAAACDSTPGRWSLPAAGDVDVPTDARIWLAGELTETVVVTQADSGADVPFTLLPTGSALENRRAVVLAPDAELAPNTTYEVVGLGATVAFTTGAGPADGAVDAPLVYDAALECNRSTYGTEFYGCAVAGPTLSVFDVSGPQGVLVVDTGGGTVDEADVLAAEDVFFAPFDGSESLELRSTDGPYRFGVLTVDGRWSGFTAVAAPTGDPCSSDTGVPGEGPPGEGCGGCDVGGGASGWLALLGAGAVRRARRAGPSTTCGARDGRAEPSAT